MNQSGEADIYVEPSEWVQCFTEDGRVYFANTRTKQTQWKPPPIINLHSIEAQNIEFAIAASMNDKVLPNNVNKVLPNGINSGIQNDKTKANIKDPDDAKTLIQRKIYDKEHIIWLLTFCLGIYDYVTDIEVAMHWLQMTTICSQFKCDTIARYSDGTPFSTVHAQWLLIFSSIGFVFGLALKCIEIKALIRIFKHPISKQEMEASDHTNWKRFLCWGWFTVFVEDAVAVFLMFHNFVSSLYFSTYDVETRAIAMSLLSIFLAIINSCYKRYKLKKAMGAAYNYYVEKVKNCHTAWGSTITIYALIMLFKVIAMMLTLLSFQLQEPPLIDISGDTDFNYGGVFYDTVRLCNHYGNLGFFNSSYNGSLTVLPHVMYDNCSAVDYEFDVLCTENGLDNIQLNCTLNWRYKYDLDNTSNCYNDVDFCSFNVYTGTCSDYVINCNNAFTFSDDSNPVMWICFGYC